eukprot:3195207-Amphidinium_carterae.2
MQAKFHHVFMLHTFRKCQLKKVLNLITEQLQVPKGEAFRSGCTLYPGIAQCPLKVEMIRIILSCPSLTMVQSLLLTSGSYAFGNMRLRYLMRFWASVSIVANAILSLSVPWTWAKPFLASATSVSFVMCALSTHAEEVVFNHMPV